MRGARLGVALAVVLSSWLLDGVARAGPKTITGVVNINTASATELQLLPGIGPAKADLILAYRRLRPFRTVEELARVKGIGPKTVRRLKPHLAVRGESSARLATAARGAPDAVSAAGAPAPVPTPAPSPAPRTPSPSAAAAEAGFSCPANHCRGMW